jgi:probable rRNA maturation factor
LEITNLTRQKIDEKDLKRVAKKTIKILGKKGLENLSLVFACDARMKALNKKYRQRNRATDILSFEGLNEIVICLPQAARQAKELKTPLLDELKRLLIHGIVHLKGYEHEHGGKEAEKMQKIENKILAKLK